MLMIFGRNVAETYTRHKEKVSMFEEKLRLDAVKNV